jgi:amino acid transporter, AAT family
MHFFLYFAQELTWGAAIRGTRRDFAPDWRWLHVGEMAVFWLVPALFLNFYCNNWPKRFSLPVNVLVRTVITLAAAILLYIFYYATSHDIPGHPEGLFPPAAVPHDSHHLADQHLAGAPLVHGQLAGLEDGAQNRR